jgi:hypothetical protein
MLSFDDWGESLVGYDDLVSNSIFFNYDWRSNLSGFQVTNMPADFLVHVHVLSLKMNCLT